MNRERGEMVIKLELFHAAIVMSFVLIVSAKAEAILAYHVFVSSTSRYPCTSAISSERSDQEINGRVLTSSANITTTLLLTG